MKAYTIVVKDYHAEIVELEVIEIINMPDDSRVFHASSKYGTDYYTDSDVRSIRRELEKECREINAEFAKRRGNGNAGSHHQNNK